MQVFVFSKRKKKDTALQHLSALFAKEHTDVTGNKQ